MRVLFRSPDFASIDGAGLGFYNRRPVGSPWQFQGTVQHPQWQGNYECYWKGSELFWTIYGDDRLLNLSKALQSRGYAVEVKQDKEP
jgi:hypothetical protein